MTDAERTAAHEAGHACACVLLGVPVRLIDVVGDARSLGVVRHGLEQMYNRDDARKRIIQSALMGAGLLVFLVVWFVLPHGSKVPSAAVASGKNSSPSTAL